MSAKREITVVINGEEFVSKVAKEAEAGLTIFGMRIPIVLDASKLLEKGLELLSAGFAKAKEWVVNSLAAYDDYAASQRKLEGTSKLTGVALADLQDIAQRGTDGFKLSSITANEYSAEIAKLTSKAGDLGKSKDALAAFLDIGAARGLNANDTLKAVQQAIIGIDEGTDKLFGKNPSVLYEEYAAKIGTSAGKLSDQQKALALLDATMEGGERVKGAYLDYLNSAAGQQDLLNQRIESSQVSFGAALQPLRTLVLQGLNKLLDVLLPVVDWVGKASTEIGVTLVQGVNRGREVIGNLAAAVGRLTGMKDLQKWGQESAAAARQSIAAVDDTVRKVSEGTKASADTVQAAHKATTRVVEEESKKQKQATADALEAMRARWKLVDDAAVSYRKVIETLKPAVERNVTLREIDAQSAALDAARQNADGLIRKMQEHGALPSLIKKTEDAVRDVGGRLNDAAGFALDVAGHFGGIDEEARVLLQSVKDVGASVGSLMEKGLSFAGVSGLLGGIASVVSTMMQGDRERRDLTRLNNTRLEELNRGISALKLNVTGQDYETISGALKQLFGNLQGGAQIAPSLYQFDRSIYNAGLTQADLNKVAEAYGINLRRSNGDIDLAQLQKLSEAMQRAGLGNGQRTFDEALRTFRENQSLTGGTATQQALDLLNYVARSGGVGFLQGFEGGNAEAIFGQLLSLRNQLTSGTTLAPDQLGQMTTAQVSGLIYELLQSLKGELGSATQYAATDPTPTPQTTAVVESVDGVAISVSSVQDVITAMDQNVVTLLEAHTAYHQRIAEATESGARNLEEINDKMDTLIAVTRGQTDRTNTELASARAVAAANAGQGPAF